MMPTEQTGIEVTVRVRPILGREIENSEESIWEAFQHKDEGTICEKSGNAESNNMYTTCFQSFLDFTLPTDSGMHLGQMQQLSIARKIVHAALNGYNGTIAAYGQTSSGKTYTMLGTESSPGMIFLALTDIFRASKTRSNRTYRLSVNYMELYNEKTYDLISSSTEPSKMREASIYGLETKEISSAGEFVKILLQGEMKRKTAATKYNDRSSRSHTIYRIRIHSKTNDAENREFFSVLNLVDLAGSESIKHLKSEEQKLECKFINKSLNSLSRVVMALSQKNKPERKRKEVFNLSSPLFESQNKKKSQVHIPYRDSVLTRVLKESLGGNSNTVIICMLSPSLRCREESMNTLRFGQFASKIENHAQLNEINHKKDPEKLIKRYKLICQNLKAKIKKLSKEKASIRSMERSNIELQKSLDDSLAVREQLSAEIDEMKKKISKMESEQFGQKNIQRSSVPSVSAGSRKKKRLRIIFSKKKMEEPAELDFSEKEYQKALEGVLNQAEETKRDLARKNNGFDLLKSPMSVEARGNEREIVDLKVRLAIAENRISKVLSQLGSFCSIFYQL